MRLPPAAMLQSRHRRCAKTPFGCLCTGDKSRDPSISLSIFRRAAPWGRCRGLQRRARGADETKGADEQSSRRTPGSPSGPGVCFLAEILALLERRRIRWYAPRAHRSARTQGTMRTRWMLGMLVAAACAAPAAQAQETNDTGIRTETQERLRSGPPDISWFDCLALWDC